MSRIIKCQVNDEYVLGSGVPIGAAGSHGDVILQLQFNDMWDGLSIIATFRDAMNERAEAIMLIPGDLVDGEVRTYQVRIPAMAKRIAGRARLTLSGYSVYTINDDGTIKHALDSLTNTATAFFRVLESDSAILDDGSITDASFAQQAQTEINRAGKIITEAEAAVDDATAKIVEFEDAEKTRQDNETARVEAEEARETKENERLSKEAERVQSENTRETSETARINAEGDRETEETKRIKAEGERQENETERVDNETARRTYENIRRDAETKRVAAEEERKKGEARRSKQIGKIDEALDYIREIQKTLIGGGK